MNPKKVFVYNFADIHQIKICQGCHVTDPIHIWTDDTNYWGYCQACGKKNVCGLSGKIFSFWPYEGLNSFQEVLPPLKTAEKCSCSGGCDIFCGNFYRYILSGKSEKVAAPCLKHEIFYSGWKKLTSEEAKEWEPPKIEEIQFKVPDLYMYEWPKSDVTNPIPEPFYKPGKIKKVSNIDEIKAMAVEPKPLISGEVFMYHLIYKEGSMTYHFSVIAKDEEEAKEKIIKERRDNHDQYFPEEIRKLRAYKQKGEVLSIYEKVG